MCEKEEAIKSDDRSLGTRIISHMFIGGTPDEEDKFCVGTQLSLLQLVVGANVVQNLGQLSRNVGALWLISEGIGNVGDLHILALWSPIAVESVDVVGVAFGTGRSPVVEFILVLEGAVGSDVQLLVLHHHVRPGRSDGNQDSQGDLQREL